MNPNPLKRRRTSWWKGRFELIRMVEWRECFSLSLWVLQDKRGFGFVSESWGHLLGATRLTNEKTVEGHGCLIQNTYTALLLVAFLSRDLNSRRGHLFDGLWEYIQLCCFLYQSYHISTLCKTAASAVGVQDGSSYQVPACAEGERSFAFLQFCCVCTLNTPINWYTQVQMEGTSSSHFCKWIPLLSLLFCSVNNIDERIKNTLHSIPFLSLLMCIKVTLT